MNYLEMELARLTRLEKAIRGSGDIAPDNCRIDIYSPSGRKTKYARKRTDEPIFDGKKTQGLGLKDEQKHNAFKVAIQRRDALVEIGKREIALQAMIDAPIWEPGAPPIEIDQSEYVPLATKPPAQKKGRVSKSGNTFSRSI